MAKDTFSRGDKRRAAAAERVELPYLHKVMSKIRPGLYPVNRIAYLKGWEYWILETSKFKVKVTPTHNKCEADKIRLLPDESCTFFIGVEEEDYYICWNSEDADWHEYDGEKATNFTCDVDTSRRELPDEYDIDSPDFPY